uniref:Uncharacterized protein n=1 Tax=Faecalibaculum rodentium TaxID=1702221 RepID=A0A140DV40_9FIRM|nr:hypothetical protein AALO17_13830 [Faecalibaculum rodentium]
MYQNKKRRYSVSPGCHAISRNCIRDIINPDFTGSKAVFCDPDIGWHPVSSRAASTPLRGPERQAVFRG